MHNANAIIITRHLDIFMSRKIMLMARNTPLTSTSRIPTHIFGMLTTRFRMVTYRFRIVMSLCSIFYMMLMHDIQC